MLMRYPKSGQRSRSEASYLCFDGQVGLNININRLPVSGQETLVADKYEKSTQVLGKPVIQSWDSHVPNFKLAQGATSPKATVCTLLPGQYLPCGIGISVAEKSLFDLTSVDVRRWELCASAISEILKTTSPRDKDNAADTKKVEELNMFLKEHILGETFVIHIPNLRMDHIERDWYEHLWFGPSLLGETGRLLLYLVRFFIPLTAAYGGIHLSAWNFEFPSRFESITWRTACFIIIGGSFALLTVPSYKGLDSHFMIRYYAFPWSSGSKKKRLLKLMRALNRMVGYGFAGLLLLCYAASRVYLVIESFISLRQVPIGVYAADPWVQNIPHV